MARLFAFLFITQVVLAALALIGCLGAEEGEIRALPRLVWALIILFIPLIGAIAWFVAGRPVTATQRPGVWRAGGGFPERQRPRPVAPDDDPEFLRSLGAEKAKKDRELFEKWEQDLRRREEELRRRDGGDQGDSGRRADPDGRAESGGRAEAGDPPREEKRPEA